MSVTLDASELVGAIAGSSLLSSAATAFFSRRRDTFAVFTKAYETLAVRVTALEVKLASVEENLSAEKTQHEHTKSLLRLALEHIRLVIAWGASDRVLPLPTPPRELMVRA